jgi:hypothetical protein
MWIFFSDISFRENMKLYNNKNYCHKFLVKLFFEKINKIYTNVYILKGILLQLVS